MRWIYNKTINICGTYSSQEEGFEFCWNLFADRNIKLNKFAFGTTWLLDLLFKHWFYVISMECLSPSRRHSSQETSPAARSKEKQLFSQAIKCRGLGIFPSYLNVVPGYFHWKIEKKNRNQKISLADPSNVGAARKVFPHLSQRTITHYCISLFPIVSWLEYRTNCLLGLGEVPSCLIPRLLVVFTRQLRNLSDNPDLSLHNIGRR